MKKIHFLILVACIAIFAGCAAVPPNELVNARLAYRQASAGPATKFAPAELHKANDALVLAEQSFQEDSDSYKTKDLAYVAQRKSQLAGAIGKMAADKASKDKANADFDKKQTEIVKQGKEDLNNAELQTAVLLGAMASDKANKDKADAEIEKQDAEIAKQKQDLIDSDKRTADVMAELAKLAAVKEEERGLVVTLSGGVLFRSAESTLMSSAQTKLDQVANALLSVRTRNIIIEGHTDSQGSDSYNQDLSQRRANAVRDYLVQKGYPADHIQTRGMSEDSPIADNASPEGRANNRRVEIVIEREVQTSSQQ